MIQWYTFFFFGMGNVLLEYFLTFTPKNWGTQILFKLSPKDIPIFTNIFEMGWFNHQLPNTGGHAVLEPMRSLTKQRMILQALVAGEPNVCPTFGERV